MFENHTTKQLWKLNTEAWNNKPRLHGVLKATGSLLMRRTKKVK